MLYPIHVVIAKIIQIYSIFQFGKGILPRVYGALYLSNSWPASSRNRIEVCRAVDELLKALQIAVSILFERLFLTSYSQL